MANTFSDTASLYGYVFKKIRCDFQFSAHKLTLIDNIENKATYTNSEQFSVLPTKFGYSFSATKDELKEHAEICEFLAAHEIYHAVIHEKSFTKICKYKFLEGNASKFLTYSSNKITDHADAIFNLANKNSSDISLKYHTSCLGFWEMGGKLASLVYNYASQKEELACDKFAAKIFPETSLKKFSEFLDFDPETNNNLLKTHPLNDLRLAHLRKYLQD